MVTGFISCSSERVRSTSRSRVEPALPEHLADGNPDGSVHVDLDLARLHDLYVELMPRAFRPGHCREWLVPTSLR